MTFEYVCFSITNQCNQGCKYCYRVGSNNASISEEDFVQCLNCLKALGCKIINISGGEPLVHDKWDRYIKIAYDMGYLVVLSSNGLLLDLNDSVLNYVKEIAISLDGSNEDIDSIYRGAGHFAKVISLVDQYRNSDYKFKLKIGTVMTKNNYYDLVNIIPLIDNADVYWRVFFCRNKGDYNHIDPSLLLSKEEYLEKIDELNSVMPSTINFMYECCTEDGTMQKTSTVVSPDSSVYVCEADTDMLIGNLITMSPEQLLDNARKQGYVIHGHKLYYNDFI